MRAYTEYVLLMGLAFILFLAYLIVITRADSVSLDLNGLKIPNNAINNNVSLYIDSDCTDNNFASLKHNNNFYSSTINNLLISNFQVPSNNNSDAIISIGYADTTILCGSLPTNPVYLYKNKIPDKDDYLSIDAFLSVPAGKYPFVNINGYNFNFSATGTEY